MYPKSLIEFPHFVLRLERTFTIKDYVNICNISPMIFIVYPINYIKHPVF